MASDELLSDKELAKAVGYERLGSDPFLVDADDLRAVEAAVRAHDRETNLLMKAARELADERKATVARLREALRAIAANTCCGPCQEAALVARAALAKQPDE